jgi:hypothetical protein
VDRSLGRLQQGNLSLICLHHGRLIRAALIRLDCLVLRNKLSSHLDKVVWGIFWKVLRRLCGPPTRSVGPTNRSEGLLVGWTHSLGTAVSLVGGDPGVPMSHNEELENFERNQVWELVDSPQGISRLGQNGCGRTKRERKVKW